MRNLGLIGGLGPGATVRYHRELSKAQAGEMMIILTYPFFPHSEIETENGFRIRKIGRRNVKRQ